MKIGILTFWWTQDNYGQVLQCFALIKFLREMGHDAFLIKAIPNPPRKTLLRQIKNLIKNCIPTYRRWEQLGKIQDKENRKHPRNFDNFRAHHIPSTDTIYSQKRLMEEPPKADAYICGSDQVWCGPSPIYFLQFGSKSTKRIAYAPSMGGIKPRGEVRQTMIEYLQRFDFLSSREKQGVEELHEMGFPEASLQPDPTLLLPVETYREIAIGPQKAEKPYLLLYLLGNETNVNVGDIYSFADTHNLEVRYIASQGRIDEYPKLYPTVEEWLGLIDGATYVVTNSFHGTVFCLQFNTPFLVLPVKGAIARMNNRIYDLLERYGLSRRIYQGSLERLFESMDFQLFNNLRGKDSNSTKKMLTEKLN